MKSSKIEVDIESDTDILLMLLLLIIISKYSMHFWLISEITEVINIQRRDASIWNKLSISC